MASKVLKRRCACPPLGQACQQLGALTGPDPWGSTGHGSVTIPLSVLRMSVGVPLLSLAWLPRRAFADVNQSPSQVLVPLLWRLKFLCRRLTFGETTKGLPFRGEGWPSLLRAYKSSIFPKGKSQHTPLPGRKSTRSKRHHYTSLTNASTSLRRQGEHNRTQSLPGLLTPTPTHTTGWYRRRCLEPYWLPSEIPSTYSASRQLWPERDASTPFPHRAWREKSTVRARSV